jgi:crotonobetainyl-CoA:carnitine CoA-transferase CaiB-like acyl-CoA transferase
MPVRPPRPLDGILVLDFSTLLPGPMAGLILAEAGAEVIKIERPGQGDEMRRYRPKLGADSGNFAVLNRGKRSVAIDLKEPGAVARLGRLLQRADILIEQFRPGVMDRLGLGFDAVAAINPRLIYCSITGYGQHGPKSQLAGHDLNYMAEAGLLSLISGADGMLAVPHALIADIGGGAYPAVINVLLALQQRHASGRGCHLDIAMHENLFSFLHWALAQGWCTGEWPGANSGTTTGGSPRYRIYRMADGRFLAAAPLEDRFWRDFCDAIGLSTDATHAEVAARIAEHGSAEWAGRFAGRDVCCAIVASVAEAVTDPHVAARGIFAHTVAADGESMPALPVPVVPQFRAPATEAASPALGEANDLLDA